MIQPRYSSKHRLGMIVPSLNVTIEPEFNAVAPRSVSIHATRLMLERGTKKDLERMTKNTEDACRLLESAKVGVILYACTTGSLIGGKKWESQLIQRMKSSVTIPVLTTAGAVIEAINEMGLKKIAVATPYADQLNLAEKQFFEENGFEVTKLKGLGYYTGEELHSELPETTMRLARQVDSKDADGIFLSCTDLKTVTVLSRLENELGKPVLSSNAASLWASLRALRVKEIVRGCGSLLSSH
ncbi:MAG: aspartate/glutamate racemase family protein [Thaumarchaeota archaeon]|nr:aspartate/glutamate racemase family protein [Nitrososphaerota archaeon]